MTETELYELLVRVGVHRAAADGAFHGLGGDGRSFANGMTVEDMANMPTHQYPVSDSVTGLPPEYMDLDRQFVTRWEIKDIPAHGYALYYLKVPKDLVGLKCTAFDPTRFVQFTGPGQWEPVPVEVHFKSDLSDEPLDAYSITRENPFTLGGGIWLKYLNPHDLSSWEANNKWSDANGEDPIDGNLMSLIFSYVLRVKLNFH